MDYQYYSKCAKARNESMHLGIQILSNQLLNMKQSVLWNSSYSEDKNVGWALNG